MDRSIYEDGILVDKTDLNNAEDQDGFHILARQRDASSELGVVSGLAVTVNAVNNRRLDVATGYGYAPNGEYTELTLGQLNVALSATTAGGVVNLVCLVYTEIDERIKPHETDGSTSYVRKVRSSRLRVYTQTEYDALPASNSDLSVDARDRCVICSRITDPGSPAGLSASNIENASSFSTLNFASAPVNTTGVQIVGVSSTTQEGTGTLTYVFAAVTLQWQAPGSGVAGAAVPITTDGDYTLTGGDGSSITVRVTTVSLPSADSSDSINVSRLYEQDVPRYSVSDFLHRNLLGSGTPSPNNPHGLTLADIGEDFDNELIIHQDLLHANGIARGSISSSLAVTVDPGTAPDRLLITQPAGTDSYYVNGRRLSTISTTTISFTSGVGDRLELYEVYVDENGIPGINLRLNAVGIASVVNVKGVQYVDISKRHTTGSVALSYTNATSSLTWAGGSPVVINKSGIYRLYAQDGMNWLEVYVDYPTLSSMVADQSDTLTVSTAIDKEANLLLAMAYWTGGTLGPGFLGYGTIAGSGVVKNKRSFGNLTDDQMGDDYLEEKLEGTWRERCYPGVLLHRNNTGQFAQSLVGLGGSVEGGIAYVRGRRLEVLQASLTLIDNTINLVYVDASGSFVVVDTSVTSIVEILNSGVNNQDLGRNAVIGEQGVPLWMVTTSGGSITKTLDLRRAVDHTGSNRGAAGFSVGSSGEFFTLDGALEYGRHWFSASNSAPTFNIVGAATINNEIDPSGYSGGIVVQGSTDGGSVLFAQAGVYTNALFNLTEPQCILKDFLLYISDWSLIGNIPVINSTAQRLEVLNVRFVSVGTPGTNNHFVEMTATGTFSHSRICDCLVENVYNFVLLNTNNATTEHLTISRNRSLYTKEIAIHINTSSGTDVLRATWIKDNWLEQDPTKTASADWVGLKFTGLSQEISGFWFKNNDVIASGVVPPTSSSYIITAGNVEDLYIQKNRLVGLTAGAADQWAVQLFGNSIGSRSVWMEENHVEINTTDQTAINYWIYTNISYSFINRNFLSGSGSDPSNGQGIATTGSLSGVHIDGNTLSSLAILTGVSVLGSITKGTIAGNIFDVLTNAFATSIFISATSSYVYYGGNSTTPYATVDAAPPINGNVAMGNA